MKMLRIFIILSCLVVTTLQAQQLSCPVDTIDGKPYYKYTVEKGVGLYRVSKIFGVSQEQILKANPSINSLGLVYGNTILIPISTSSSQEKVVHKQKRQAVSNVLAEQKPVDVELEEVDSVQQLEDTLRLAIMLPLHANAIKRNATMERFVEFYMGSLIAINENQKGGQKIELYTYDVEKTSEKTKEILCDTTWHKVDAIIGPAYMQQVQEAISFTRRDSTWLLVPFVSTLTDEHSHPYVFQFNPSSQAESMVLAEYLASQEDTVNCVLIQPREGETVPASVQDVHAALQQYNIPTTTTTIRDILVDSLSMALMEDRENIIIFNTEKYSNLSALMPHLLSLVGMYKITLYSRYSWQSENILLPQIYTSVFHGDSISSEQYDMMYEEYFETLPSSQYPRYDLLGYDLTKHFLKLIQNPDTNTLQEPWDGVQSSIQYMPSSTHQGYENKKISVIRK